MGEHPFLRHPRPVGLAHRGAHGEVAGENTAEAFAHAVALGYRHLETDVHLTADGVLVALHDEDLDRVTDATGPVAGATWSDLRGVEVVGGGTISRFDDLLHAWPEVRWNVDCKAPAALDALCRAVAGDLHRVCLASFHPAVVRTLRRRLGPRLCSAATRREVVAVVAAGRLPAALLPAAGRVLARAVGADVLQVPVRDEDVEVVTPGFVRAAHAAGLDVHVWTVDDPAEQERLLDLGVDGLMSDDAPGLADTLRRRGAWPPAGVADPRARPGRA